jgi:hypothetical protein
MSVDPSGRQFSVPYGPTAGPMGLAAARVARLPHERTNSIKNGPARLTPPRPDPRGGSRERANHSTGQRPARVRLLL